MAVPNARDAIQNKRAISGLGYDTQIRQQRRLASDGRIQSEFSTMHICSPPYFAV